MSELWNCLFLIHHQQEGQPKKFNLWPKTGVEEVSAESQRMAEVGRDLQSSAGPAPHSGNFYEGVKKK